MKIECRSATVQGICGRKTWGCLASSRVARHAKFDTKCQSRKNKTGERYYMGNHVCSRVRHVYNNTDGDVQIYHSSDPSVVGWKSNVSFRLSDASYCLDPKQLIGMKLICGYNDSGSGCIRRTPDSNSLVIENDSSGVVGIQLSEFSALFHVELPSFLMNLDAVLPPRRPSSDSKFLLNRTASTSVPSPISSPSMAAKFYSASETARVACLISSHLRSWRNSDTKVPVLCVDPVHRSSLRPLEVLRRGCFGECFLVMGGMAVSIGYLETTDWEEVVNEVDIFGSERDELSQCEVYEKLLSAASLILGSASSDVDILAAVGDHSTNMSVVLSGALLLDKLREEGTIVQ